MSVISNQFRVSILEWFDASNDEEQDRLFVGIVQNPVFSDELLSDFCSSLNAEDPDYDAIALFYDGVQDYKRIMQTYADSDSPAEISHVTPKGSRTVPYFDSRLLVTPDNMQDRQAAQAGPRVRHKARASADPQKTPTVEVDVDGDVVLGDVPDIADQPPVLTPPATLASGVNDSLDAAEASTRLDNLVAAEDSPQNESEVIDADELVELVGAQDSPPPPPRVISKSPGQESAVSEDDSVSVQDEQGSEPPSLLSTTVQSDDSVHESSQDDTSADDESSESLDSLGPATQPVGPDRPRREFDTQTEMFMQEGDNGSGRESAESLSSMEVGKKPVVKPIRSKTDPDVAAIEADEIAQVRQLQRNKRALAFVTVLVAGCVILLSLVSYSQRQTDEVESRVVDDGVASHVQATSDASDKEGEELAAEKPSEVIEKSAEESTDDPSSNSEKEDVEGDESAEGESTETPQNPIDGPSSYSAGKLGAGLMVADNETSENETEEDSSGEFVLANEKDAFEQLEPTDKVLSESEAVPAEDNVTPPADNGIEPSSNQIAQKTDEQSVDETGTEPDNTTDTGVAVNVSDNDSQVGTDPAPVKLAGVTSPQINQEDGVPTQEPLTTAIMIPSSQASHDVVVSPVNREEWELRLQKRILAQVR